MLKLVFLLQRADKESEGGAGRGKRFCVLCNLCFWQQLGKSFKTVLSFRLKMSVAKTVQNIVMIALPLLYFSFHFPLFDQNLICGVGLGSILVQYTPAYTRAPVYYRIHQSTKYTGRPGLVKATLRQQHWIGHRQKSSWPKKGLVTMKEFSKQFVSFLRKSLLLYSLFPRPRVMITFLLSSLGAEIYLPVLFILRFRHRPE